MYESIDQITVTLSEHTDNWGDHVTEADVPGIIARATEAITAYCAEEWPEAEVAVKGGDMYGQQVAVRGLDDDEARSQEQAITNAIHAFCEREWAEWLPSDACPEES